MDKIASSPTKEGIVKLINQFYYTSTCAVNFKTGEVSNSKGIIESVKVEFKKHRYILSFKK